MSEEQFPVEHLVIDTGAVIKDANLHKMAKHFYAPPDVEKEIRDERSRVKWEMLPVEVQIREPSAVSIKKVIEESKKTGDYPSLSLTDLKVIALTYDLQQQFGNQELTKTAEVQDSAQSETPAQDSTESAPVQSDPDSGASEENVEEAETSNMQMIKEKIPEGFCENDVESSDEEGWINPDNFGEALKKMGAIEVEEGVVVGCISTDFAVQNVLLAMNLGLVSLMGMRIKKLRSYLLRCRCCFQTTSVMTKKFCPRCGNSALHKVAVTVNDDGSTSIHVNWRRLESKRGLRHTLAAPRGGKHAIGEQLFEDERIPQNRMARVHLDALDDSPFAINDVTSRSAVLGIRNLRPPNPRRNPNANGPKGKKKGKR